MQERCGVKLAHDADGKLQRDGCGSGGSLELLSILLGGRTGGCRRDEVGKSCWWGEGRGAATCFAGMMLYADDMV